MAQSKLFSLLAKNEATPGVDAVPTPADNGILVKDLVIKAVPKELLERLMNDPSFSQFALVVGGAIYEATFKVELKGSGTANAGGATDIPEIDPLLRSMGFGVTLTAESAGGVGDGKIEYDPVSTGIETSTIYGYEDGQLKKMLGCLVNTWRLNADAGKFGEIDMSVVGLYQDPIDTATPPGIAFNATLPAPFKNANLTVDGYSPVFQKLSIDMGLTVATRFDANAAEAIIGFAVTGRSVQGSVDPEQVLVADYPLYTNWKSSKQMPFTATLGEIDGNKIVITGPKVQHREITPGNREGIAVNEWPLHFSRVSGDDEIKFTFQ